MDETLSNKIAIFQKKEIRKVEHHGEWWFVVEDVVLALIDSADSKQYIQKMRIRDVELSKGWVQIVHTLEVPPLEEHFANHDHNHCHIS